MLLLLLAKTLFKTGKYSIFSTTQTLSKVYNDPSHLRFITHILGVLELGLISGSTVFVLVYLV